MTETEDLEIEEDLSDPEPQETNGSFFKEKGKAFYHVDGTIAISFLENVDLKYYGKSVSYREFLIWNRKQENLHTWWVSLEKQAQFNALLDAMGFDVADFEVLIPNHTRPVLFVKGTTVITVAPFCGYAWEPIPIAIDGKNNTEAKE